MLRLGQKARNPETKEYTFILVPHSGKSVHRIHLPVKSVKYIATVLCMLFVMLTGAIIDYQHTTSVAKSQKSELEYLRQINGTQIQQIQKLTNKTETLEDDVNRLNQLDGEIRHLVNSEEQPTNTSRSGSSRRYNGQGGPQADTKLSDIEVTLDRLQQEITMREHSLQELRDVLIARQEKMNSRPSIWPTSGEVTSRFGWRSSPFGGGGDYHPGIDIANDYGEPVMATANGIVVYAGWYSGYGNLVQIDHGNGIETIYGHNESILVNVGQHVNKGDIISKMGSTGYSTGPHLHYEIRVNGTAVNPANYL